MSKTLLLVLGSVLAISAIYLSTSQLSGETAQLQLSSSEPKSLKAGRHTKQVLDVEAVEHNPNRLETSNSCVYFGNVSCISYQAAYNSTYYRINDISTLADNPTSSQVCKEWGASYATGWTKRLITPTPYSGYAYVSNGVWRTDGSGEKQYCFSKISCNNGITYTC